MFEETPLIQAIYTYICYAVLNLFGWMRDFMRDTGIEKRKGAVDPNSSVFDNFYFVYFKPFPHHNSNSFIRILCLCIKAMRAFTPAMFTLG